MQSLVERAATILRRQSVPALPLRELARLVTESGTAVSEGVLLRGLATEPERFRVVHPWQGLLCGAREIRRGSGGRNGSAHVVRAGTVSARPKPDPVAAGVRASAPRGYAAAPSDGASSRTGPASAPALPLEEVWVLPGRRAERGDLPCVERAALRRMRATLVGLGWAIDAGSARDVARWAGMVLEGERLRTSVPPEQRARHAEG